MTSANRVAYLQTHKSDLALVSRWQALQRSREEMIASEPQRIPEAALPVKPGNTAELLIVNPYHSPMRLLLFILMLALLPIRGWMGDAMATGMAVAELQAAANPKTAMHSAANQTSKRMAGSGPNVETTSHHAVSAVSDCAGHAAAAPTDANHTDDADHCTPCPACGACHSASMSTAALAWSAVVHGSTPMIWPADAFFSADAVPRQKTPIS